MDSSMPLWSRFRRRRERHGFVAPSAGRGPVVPTSIDQTFPDSCRRQRVAQVLKRGLAQAEEKYLVAPEATLGTWLARVTETLAVAARIILVRIEEGRRLEEEEVASEQLGLFADICAETIRATSKVWGEAPAELAREEVLAAIFATPRTLTGPSWVGALGSLTQCLAAVEPLANGLRDGDLPMGEPTECDLVAAALLEVGVHALQAIESLC